MDIQIPQILFQMINFGVVTGALTVLLYKPIKKMLDERSARIDEAQKAAEATISEKKNIDELKRKAVRDAEKEAAAIVEEATKDASTRRKELMSQAKKEAQAEYERLLKSFGDEKQSMLSSMKEEFADVVIAAATKVTVAALSKKDHAKLIDTELETLLQRV